MAGIYKLTIEAYERLILIHALETYASRQDANEVDASGTRELLSKLEASRPFEGRARLADVLETLTPEKIEALQVEAGRAGDTRMVETCMRAVDGDALARVACAEVIWDAEGRR